MFVCVIVNMFVRPYVSMIELVLHTNVCVCSFVSQAHIERESDCSFIRSFVCLFVLGFTLLLIFRASILTLSHSS